MYQSRCLHGEIVLTRESERGQAPAIAQRVYVYLYLCALGSMQPTYRIGGALSFSLFLPRERKKPQTKHTQHYTYCRLIRPLGRRPAQESAPSEFDSENGAANCWPFSFRHAAQLWDKLTEGPRGWSNSRIGSDTHIGFTLNESRKYLAIKHLYVRKMPNLEANIF